ALKASGAKPLSQAEAPALYQDIAELTGRAGLPMPRVYLIPSDQPNAFATGRNAKHAAVAVTQGLLTLMPRDQVRGVLAHELARALESLERATEQIPMQANPATASLYIADPLKALHGRGMTSLFSTHPPLEERVRRLRAMRSFA